MGVEIGNLTQGAQKRWTVETAEDVPTAAESIFEDCKRFGLPCYEKFSDPRAAFVALSHKSIRMDAFRAPQLGARWKVGRRH